LRRPKLLNKLKDNSLKLKPTPLLKTICIFNQILPKTPLCSQQWLKKFTGSFHKTSRTVIAAKQDRALFRGTQGTFLSRLRIKIKLITPSNQINNLILQLIRINLRFKTFRIQRIKWSPEASAKSVRRIQLIKGHQRLRLHLWEESKRLGNLTKETWTLMMLIQKRLIKYQPYTRRNNHLSFQIKIQTPIKAKLLMRKIQKREMTSVQRKSWRRKSKRIMNSLKL